MKVAERENSVYQEGGEAGNSFGMLINAKAFKVLADGIYSNKVKAVIRELSTNAYDSVVRKHIKNGQTPQAAKEGATFKVHLPSYSNPEFYVEDEGEGLSKKKLVEVYTIFFASDKTDSNDVVGCLGLGSKTPFAYNTYSFTAESWYEGRHYIIHCYLMENGEPGYSILLDEETDHPNGVKVSFPVKVSDINRFADNAREVYKWFETKPEFVGDNQIEIEEVEYSITGNGWKFSENLDQAYAIMGNIAYPLQNADGCGFSSIEQKVIGTPIVFHFNIGEIDMETSREGLSYTDKTVRRLKNRFANTIKDATESVQEKLDKEDCLWDAKVKYSNLRYSSEEFLDLVDINILNFDGAVITNGISIRTDFSCMKDLNVIKFSRDSWRNTVNENISRVVIPSDDIYLFENDLKIGQKVRAKHVCSMNSNRQVFVFTFKDAAEKQELIEKLGIKPKHIKPISTITPPKNTTVRNSRGGKTKVTKFNAAYYYGAKGDFWTNTEVDLDDGGVYIERERFDYKCEKGYFRHPKFLSGVLDDLEHVGIQVPVIYSLNKANTKKIAKKSQWKSLWEWVTEQVESLEKTSDCWAVRSNYVAYDNLVQNTSLDYRTLKTFASMLDEGQEIAEFIKLVDSNKPSGNRVTSNGIIALYKKYVSDDDKSVKSTFDVEDLTKDFNRKYPMLKWCMGNVSAHLDLVEYVKEIDNVYSKNV
jgi:hypothetical protein